MKRYLIAFKAWDDDECEEVEKLKVLDNEKDAIELLSYMASNNDELISISQMNFRTLKIKQFKVELTDKMKLKLVEVNE